MAAFPPPPLTTRLDFPALRGFRGSRASRVLSRMISRPEGLRVALALAGATEWTRRNFARWLFEDYPRAVLATPRRWNSQLLHGAGAYVR